mgnify:FL=1
MILTADNLYPLPTPNHSLSLTVKIYFSLPSSKSQPWPVQYTQISQAFTAHTEGVSTHKGTPVLQALTNTPSTS